MHAEVVPHPPTVRCRDCGDPDVVAACHHCGRPMCRADSEGEGPSRPSAEFDDLWTDPLPAHCARCRHHVPARDRRLLAAGAALVVLGAVLLTVTATVGLGVLVLGALALWVWYRLDQRRVQAMQSGRPLLPVRPHVEAVTLVETLTGDVTLNGSGGYQATVHPATGRLTVSTTLGKPDSDRLDHYRDRYGLSPDHDLRFCAGFAVLQGPAGLRVEPAGPVDGVDGTDRAGRGVFALTGDVLQQPFLSGRARGLPELLFVRDHMLDPPPARTTLPVWLTPSLVPESDQRSLQLDLQWEAFGDPTLQLEHVDLLELRVPVAWGPLTQHSGTLGGGISSHEDQEEDGTPVRTITWRRSPVSTHDQRRRRSELSLQFRHKIGLDDTIRGCFTVRFGGALSGVTGVQLHDALGWPRPGMPTTELATLVEADFELALSQVRYQDVRVVPNGPADEAERPATQAFPGAVPDHRTVIALSNALSDAGCYVKRVVENPPRAGGREGVLNRNWDLAGRRYTGVYPIDFHLVVTGQEVRDGGFRPVGGDTQASLTVQASYTSEQMEAKVVQAWDALWDIVSGTLEERVTTSPVGAGSSPPPRARPRPETIDLSEAERSGAPADGQDQHVRRLCERRDRYTAAWRAGHLQQDDYRRLTAAIDLELDELLDVDRQR